VEGMGRVGQGTASRLAGQWHELTVKVGACTPIFSIIHGYLIMIRVYLKDEIVYIDFCARFPIEANQSPQPEQLDASCRQENLVYTKIHSKSARTGRPGWPT
jgi:hypothetical protein